MADTKRKKLPAFTSPSGTFKYPKLSGPDFGNDKYPKPDGEFSVKLVLQKDTAETQAFLAKLSPIYQEALEEGRQAFKLLKPETRKKLKSITENPLFTELLDNETEEPTGEVEFKMAMRHSGLYKKGPKAGQKWSRTPLIFDAKAQRMVKVPPIWGGTVGKINFEASAYFIPGTGATGLKLNLVAAQIIELVSEGDRSPDSLGFKSEEGFEQKDEVQQAVESAASAEADEGVDF